MDDIQPFTSDMNFSHPNLPANLSSFFKYPQIYMPLLSKLLENRGYSKRIERPLRGLRLYHFDTPIDEAAYHNHHDVEHQHDTTVKEPELPLKDNLY